MSSPPSSPLLLLPFFISFSALFFVFLLSMPFVAPFSFSKLPNYLTGKIGRDERVIFFPTPGRKLNGTHWTLPVQGWIFEPELESKKRRVVVKGVAKYFGVEDESEKAYLKQRLMPFTADNQSMKYVNVKLDGSEGVHKLPRSSKNGHFSGQIVARDDELRADEEGIVHYQASEGDRTFAGSVRLLKPTGVSIVSDIDDTVKDTNYLNRSEFYKNTFLREFKSVPGMSEFYNRCARTYDDCSFHYVSASPYQLFEELRDFLEAKERFPPATYHLKRIRIKDKSLLQFWADPTEYKLNHIEPLLRSHPERKFVLVGDSGEKDPEVYRELYRRHPDQIARIWIRDVNGGKADPKRMDGVPRELWRYFDDGYDLMKEV